MVQYVRCMQATFSAVYPNDPKGGSSCTLYLKGAEKRAAQLSPLNAPQLNHTAVITQGRK